MSLAEILDYSQSSDEHDLIALSRQGITKTQLTKLRQFTGLDTDELAAYLHITSRTLQNYRGAKLLKPSISERALSIARLYAKGFDVFGDRNNFISWMDTPNVVLGGSKPKALLDTVFGIQMLVDELIRIEHGVLA